MKAECQQSLVIFSELQVDTIAKFRFYYLSYMDIFNRYSYQ